MKVLFVASEAVPYAKTGGLADVVGTLPKYLNKIGIQTAIFLPKYRGINGIFQQEIPLIMGEAGPVKLFQNENFFFIDCPHFFEREGLYGTPEADYPDNCERFTLFCKAVVQILKDQQFDIVHCHDWQTALIPLYLRIVGLKIKTIFTIHNLGYQGRFPKIKFDILGLDEEYFSVEGIEFYGDINLLKAGILYSDLITTVSPTYAKEVQTKEYGFGLEGVLQKRREDIFGVINGIDYEIWDPATDTLIYTNYRDFHNKQKNKLGLAQECNIRPDGPLIGMVSRITSQKGFDILIKVLDQMIDLGFNFVLLGYGEDSYHEKLKKFEALYPRRVSINIKFDERLAHRIYAGSDFFLMPSQYEPCGLGQLISLKYGCVPIVRSVGGLADTVIEFDPQSLTGNGFLFREYSSTALLNALTNASKIYKEQRLFKTLSENCMKYDFSWDKSALEYRKLYEKLMKQI